MAVNLGGLFQNINQASQFRKPASQMAQMPDNMLSRSGITNPLLQQFGQGLAGLTGTDLRTPEQLQKAQQAEQEKLQVAQEQRTQQEVLTQLNTNPLFTEQEKNMYTSMYLSGDMSAQQVIAAVGAKQATQQDKAQIGQITSNLVSRGYDEEALKLLDPKDIQDIYKSQVRQDMTDAKTVEGAKAYMEILDLPTDIEESATSFVNSASWSKLSDAQRTAYFKDLEDEKKSKQQLTYFRNAVNNLPEGKEREKFSRVVEDVEAGFVAPDKAQQYLRSLQNSSITETDKVVMIGDKYRKVVNQKVGEDTIKSYFDGTGYKPVPAEALVSTQTIRPNQTFPSTASQRLVKQARVMDTSGVLSSYIGEPTGFFSSFFTSKPVTSAQVFERQLELESEAERLKQAGRNSIEVLEGLKEYVNRKTQADTPKQEEPESKLETTLVDF
jgi:hypothetical protein